MIEIILSPALALRRDIPAIEREILRLRDVLPRFALAGYREIGDDIVGFVAAQGEELPPDAVLIYVERHDDQRYVTRDDHSARLAASAAIVG